jgi:dTDP-4-dehydrorhamnose reductase
MRKRILVTGSNGMLGRYVVNEAFKAGYDVVITNRGTLDITNYDNVEKYCDAVKPDTIINCSGLTNVDYCEQIPGLNWSVNYLGAVALASQTRIIQISTDYVFSGNKTLVDPNDQRGPVNAYGWAKAAAENYIYRCPGSLIIRTSSLFGKFGNNFISKIFESAYKFNFMYGLIGKWTYPTYAKDLAKKIIELETEYVTGVVHAVNSGSTDYLEVATHAKELCNGKWIIIPKTVEDMNWYAPRPKSVLLNAGIGRMRPWKEALQDYYQELLLENRSFT